MMFLTEIEDFTEELSKLEEFMNVLPEKALRLGIRVLFAAILFFIGSKVITILRKIVKRSLEHAKAEVGIIQFLDSLMKGALYGILVLIIIENFGFDATGVVAILGSAGVTIGLAMQGSLSNLAGGVLILLLKPFRVGDFIIVPSQGNEGTVSEIGIFYTKLTTTDGKIIVLPNGSLANNAITNATESAVRRVDLTIGISYRAEIATAKAVLQGVMDNDLDVLKNQEAFVFVSDLGDSQVILGMRCYCENPKYWELRWRLLENVKLALDEAGIEIPYPQVSVHME